jgi:hypothetical protein
VSIHFSLPAGIKTAALTLNLCSIVTDYDSYIYLLDSTGQIAEGDDNRDSVTDGGCFEIALRSSILRMYLLPAGGSNSKLVPGESYELVIGGWARSEGNFGLTITLETTTASQTGRSATWSDSRVGADWSFVVCCNYIHFLLFTSQAVMELGRRLNASMVAIITALRVLPAILSMELDNVRQGVAEVSSTGIIVAI